MFQIIADKEQNLIEPQNIKLAEKRIQFCFKWVTSHSLIE